MADGSVTLNTELNNDGINKGISNIKSSFNKIGSIASTALKGAAVAIGATTAALTGISVAATNSYADLEQNVGGIETLFGGSAEKVIKNAENAYKTYKQNYSTENILGIWKRLYWEVATGGDATESC